MAERFNDLMQRGGIVMWPLLLLSLVSVTLAFERCWFFIKTNHPVRLLSVARMASLLRAGDHKTVRGLAAADRSIYGRVVLGLLSEPITEAAIVAAVESQRGRVERFMPTLSTIITAAPMLGILGTVLGIISSFQILSSQTTVTDPRSVSQGIAEALITTAVGLVVALVTLFPYNAYRAQVNRTLSRIEFLAAAGLEPRSVSGPSGAGSVPASARGPRP